MNYSPTAQPEMNESHIHELPKNNGLIFHMGNVSGRTVALNNGIQFSCFQFEQLFSSV